MLLWFYKCSLIFGYCCYYKYNKYLLAFSLFSHLFLLKQNILLDENIESFGEDCRCVLCYCVYEALDSVDGNTAVQLHDVTQTLSHSLSRSWTDAACHGCQQTTLYLLENNCSPLKRLLQLIKNQIKIYCSLWENKEHHSSKNRPNIKQFSHHEGIQATEQLFEMWHKYITVTNDKLLIQAV